MYTLIAGLHSEAWTGEVRRGQFPTLEAAEQQMTTWARFGVDSYCTAANVLVILDAHGTPLRRWDRRRKRIVPVTAG